MDYLNKVLGINVVYENLIFKGTGISYDKISLTNGKVR